jgi:AcrR family transcriptional regulator
MATSSASVRRDKPRAGRPKREHADQRLNQLLDIAIATFIDLGYSAATIDGIALAAGVGKQTIYSRYPDKEALFTAAIKRLSDRHIFEAVSADGRLGIEEGLRRRAVAFMRYLLQPDSFALYTLLKREGHRFPELSRILESAARAQFSDPLTEYFQLQCERGALKKIEPRRAARLFMHLAVGEINRCLLLNAPFPSDAQIDAHAKEITQLFLYGLSA